jgi:hypothetical protein
MAMSMKNWENNQQKEVVHIEHAHWQQQNAMQCAH